MIKQKINKKIGFTLVETLVAISILSLSILAGFTAVQNGIGSSLTAKDQITAFYLAQEAMEYVKNIRDENALNFINGGTNTWLTGISSQASDPCSFGKTCYIDSPAKTVTTCAGINTTCPLLYRNSTTNLWGYTTTSGWVPTNFKRAITFTSVSADEVNVTVWISWTQGSNTKTFQVTQTLLNRLQ